jgi:hypothetical protein
MKAIKVNETNVVCSHEIKTDEAHHTSIHVTVEAGDVKTTHVMTIGSVDEPLPVGYDAAALQQDLDEFRRKVATMAESKLRAKQIAKSLT